MCDEMSLAGIKTITVRHEQTGAYAAEAYSKSNPASPVYATERWGRVWVMPSVPFSRPTRVILLFYF